MHRNEGIHRGERGARRGKGAHPSGRSFSATSAFSAVNVLRYLLGLGCLSAALRVPAVTAQTYVVVVSGVGGDPEFSNRFIQWGAATVEAARQRLGVPDSDITFLAEYPERDKRVNGPATRERLQAALEGIGRRAAPSADLLLVLFGHGSDRENDPRFNLAGPDVTAGELGGWLSTLLLRRIVVVNTTSASGGFVPALAGPGRVVIAATRSGFERNATQFGGFWARALGADSADGADTDKDGRLSVLEAFNYARREVARAYQRDQRLLTEHAVLDDDGDGKGSTDPTATAGDGVVAASVFLTSSNTVAAAASADPELRRLYALRDSLERRVAELRAAKGAMTPDVYERTLEDTLVELATTTRAIRERETRRP